MAKKLLEQLDFWRAFVENTVQAPSLSLAGVKNGAAVIMKHGNGTFLAYFEFFCVNVLTSGFVIWIITGLQR